MGFRCKYEYDAKAVLLYTDKQLCLLSYTLESLGETSVPNLAATFKASANKRGQAQDRHSSDLSPDGSDGETSNSNTND